MPREGLLCAIEGSDASGKETQTSELYHHLNLDGITCARDTFPRYITPTGKIIAGPILGKKKIGETELCDSYFEDPSKIPSIVASLYYAADRTYNLPFLKELLDSNEVVVLDRYVESNIGHQGGKIKDPKERLKFFKKIENLEYKWCGLPRPDLTIFLYVPFEKTMELSLQRGVSRDRVEESVEYLKNSEESFLQASKHYGWAQVDCINNGKLRLKEDIHKEVYSLVHKAIKKKEHPIIFAFGS